jgi:aminoglycoside phosphotransferase (APT) family kinase protein
MVRVEGTVIANETVADAELSDAFARRRAGEQLVDVLADLHRVDPDTVGLGDAARRDDFLGRQLRRFSAMWLRNRTREVAGMDELADRLGSLPPEPRGSQIVHGDYRIGNVMFDPDGTLTAVLDWELWTLGDGLADLGFMLNNWYEPDDDDPPVFMERPPTVTGQFGSRGEVIERYASRTGVDVVAIDYHRAFQHWRMAVIAEGVKRRYETGQMATDDVDFDHLARRVVDLAELAGKYLARYDSRARTRK